MMTSPSLDDLLEGVIVSLAADVMPALADERVMATVAMMQGVLQMVRQSLPAIDGMLVDEHNSMTSALREAAAALGDAPGHAADRIRARAVGIGATPDLPPPLDRDAIVAVHRELGRAMVETFVDLDALTRAGVGSADRALAIVRGHWGPRYQRDAETVLVGAGFVGRG